MRRFHGSLDTVKTITKARVRRRPGSQTRRSPFPSKSERLDHQSKSVKDLITSDRACTRCVYEKGVAELQSMHKLDLREGVLQSTHEVHPRKQWSRL